MAKARKNKKITLRDFNNWLSGLEEIQPDEWAPNKDQWELIRNKIKCIIEEPPVLTPQHPAYNPQNVQRRAAVAPVQQPMQPVTPPPAMVPQQPANPSFVQNEKVAAPASNVDSSDGSFDSTFE